MNKTTQITSVRRLGGIDGFPESASELGSHVSRVRGTWTFCGGAEHWLRLAGLAEGGVLSRPLPGLSRPMRWAMRQEVLGGKPRAGRFLDTYLAMEVFHAEDLPQDWPTELVNRSKAMLLQVAQDVAGAAGLPDFNRSQDEAPVPLGVTKESAEKNRTEVVRQFRRYLDLMANTRVAQA
ncbi:unnamed protein product, partial [Effrenium voratum]